MKMKSILRRRILSLMALLFCHQVTSAQNFSQMIKLIENDRQNPSSSVRNPLDYFGFAVAVSGDYAVVGAYQKDETLPVTISNSGAAYLFHLESGIWKVQQKLTASDKAANDFFGYSVAISGDYVVVGAYQEDEDNAGGNTQPDAGAAYIFKRTGTTWDQQQKIVASDRAVADQFGRAVAISGDYVVIGAQQSDVDATITDAGAAYVFVRNGSTWTQQKKLMASDAATSDYFGSAISISGDYIIAGAYAEDHNAAGTALLSGAGSAYIFIRNGTDWTQQQKIVAADRAASDFFGRSVSISGAYAVIGAYNKRLDATTPSAGAVYVFSRANTTWTQQQKIVATDAAASDAFGHSVAISGDHLIVGAYLEDEDAMASVGSTLSNAGSAYMYTRIGSAWTQEQKIVAADRDAGDYFGYAVSISGENAFLGAYQERENENGTNSNIGAGSAYAFVRTGTNWAQAKKLVAAEQVGEDYFGYAVAVDGDYAVIGAYGEDEDTSGGNTINNAGAAYIFHRNNNAWEFQQKITQADRFQNDFFGSAVAISGDYIIVGAYAEDEDANGLNNASSSGAAYLFSRSGNTWSQQQKITAADREANDYFGYAVSINGDYAVVGAYQEDHDATGVGGMAANAGAVYVFNRNGSIWTQQQKLVAADRQANDWFGHSVAINGSSVIVGAYQEDEDPAGNNFLSSAGAAYIYTRSGTVWTQQQKIVAAGRVIGEHFGFSVGLSNDFAIIGAKRDSRSGNGFNGLANAGAAYIFARNAGVWTEQQRLIAKDRAVDDFFGQAVAISGNYAVVGAYQEDEDALESNGLSNAGAVYIFQRVGNAWPLVQKLVSSDRGADDNFGCSVAINGSDVLVGAPYEDDDLVGSSSLYNAGSAYLFEAPPSPLPIKIISFTARPLTRERNMVSWTTGSDCSGTTFEITRSGDGKSFGIIGTVQGDKSLNTYTAYDDQLLSGIAYYRLKITEPNNQISYSNVVAVNSSNPSPGFILSPLPVTNTLFIKNADESLNGKNVTIYNMAGHQVCRFVLDTVVRLNTESWAAGLYYAQMPNGEHLKIVKQ